MAMSLCRIWKLASRTGSYGTSFSCTQSSAIKRSLGVQELVDKRLNSKSESELVTNEPLSKDLDSVLDSMKKKNLAVTTAADLLGSLSSVLVTNASLREQVKGSSGLQNVCRTLHKDCPNLSHTSLIYLFRNLLLLRMQSLEQALKSVETEVTWKLRRMSIKNLLFVLNVCHEYKKDELQKNTVSEIQRRWVEVSNIQETCLLLAHHSKFNSDFISKLEDRTMDIVEKAKAEDIAKLFVVLANLKQRSTPLLRCMAFHLSKHPEKLDTKKMTNVLCSMNSLSFPDHLLLQRISSDLRPEIVNIEKSSNVAAILTSLGQLKWKDTGLLNGFTEWMLRNFDACRTQDLVAYLLTIAGFNYAPHSVNDIVDKLQVRVTEEAVNNPHVWLDVVWSLVVLGRVSSNHLKSVLKPEFYSNLQSIPNKLKLRSINVAASLELLDYKGPKIASEFFEDVSVLRSKAMQKLSVSVIDALSNFLPRGKFLTPNKMTPIGLAIDAEFAVDSNTKPLPINEPNTNQVSGSLKKLPSNVYRVALLLWDYKDYTLNNPDLTGMNALNVRLLRRLGYLVVQVPCTEFMGIKTTLNRVQYLQAKIADTVKTERELCSKDPLRK